MKRPKEDRMKPTADDRDPLASAAAKKQLRAVLTAHAICCGAILLAAILLAGPRATADPIHEDDESLNPSLATDRAGASHEQQLSGGVAGSGLGDLAATVAEIWNDAVEASGSYLGRCAAASLASARTDFLDGQLESAEAKLRTMLACSPDSEDNERVRFLMAEVRIARNDFAGAERMLSELDEALAEGAEAVLPDYVAHRRGQALVGQGRHAEAAEIFAEVAADKYGPLTHEAAVAHAVALFDAGQYEASDKHLSEVLDKYPEHPRYERLLLRRGEAREALGKGEDAARDYDRVAFNWAWKEAAVTAEQGLTRLKAAGIAVPTHSFEQRFERARSLRINKHWAIAEAGYRDLLEQKKTESGRSETENRLQFQIALNFYSASRYDDALGVLHHLLEGVKTSKSRGVTRDSVYKYIVRCLAYKGETEAARKMLEERNSGLSKRAQALALAGFYEDNGEFDKSLALFSKNLSDGQKRTWDYAFLEQKAGNHSAAARKFKWLSKRASGTTKAKYLYWAGRAYQDAGKLNQARDAFDVVLGSHPLHYYGYQASNRLEEIGHYEVTVRPMVLAAAAAVGGARMGGATVAAVPSTSPVLVAAGESASSGSEDQHGASGPVAKVDTSAPTGLGPLQGTATANAKTDAAREVAGIRLPSGEVSVRDLPIDEQVDRTETARAQIFWSSLPFATGELRADDIAGATGLEGRTGGFMPAYAEGESVVGALGAAAAAYGEEFPRLHRATFLHDVGLETEARWEIRDVALEYRGLREKTRAPAATKPIRLGYRLGKHYIDNRRTDRTGYWGLKLSSFRFPVPASKSAKAELAARQGRIIKKKREMHDALVLALKEAGEFHIVRRFGKSTGYHRSDPLAGARRDEWMEVYPRAFPRLVQKHAAENDLNPYLMWALMTVESSYNPDSISYADARGLLQVIPKTGIKCATTLGVDEYGPHDLLDERVSIKFGTWYFSQLVHKFHGQELFAIAGYNGGPHNVARWVTQRGGDLAMDEFVETIPFDQARGYTKKVLRYAGLYQRLYESNSTLYVGNRIEPQFKAHPNY